MTMSMAAHLLSIYLPRRDELTSLSLQITQILTPLINLLDIVPHHTDSLIDLSLDMGSLVVALRRRSTDASSTGRVWIVA